jgi:antirestriction protein ArdC
MFYNAKTNNFYSENNQELLAASAESNDFESLKVAGFGQWKELGRVVKKGSKSCKIVMVVDKKDDKEKNANSGKEDKKFKVVKFASVFFEDQTEELKTEVAA